jgi:hypothetical protein
MARLGRVVLPNDPHHDVQHGHDKQVVFAEEADDRYHLDTLATVKAELDIKVYALCLMSNHLHWVVQPGRRAGAVVRRPGISRTQPSLSLRADLRRGGGTARRALQPAGHARPADRARSQDRVDGGAAGMPFKAQPLTLVAYRVDCERVVNLTDRLALSAIGITLETLRSPGRRDVSELQTHARKNSRSRP